MKVLFTLDYELFLGAKTGSVEKCLLEPLKQMLEVTEKIGVKFSLFVDATYLYRLSEYSEKFPALKYEFDKLSRHLCLLHEAGHDIQLHVHPHWAYSTYDGEQWVLDHEHYKLSDLTAEEAGLVFARAKILLEKVVGKSVCAFRAGGFSAQPVERLLKLFKDNHITIDSSVYPGNYYKSSYQDYDYRKCPKKSVYRFEHDICQEEVGGSILEVPLTTYCLSPWFYWKLVLTKLMKRFEHQVIGDGVSVKTTGDSIRERLMKESLGFVTIDGYKASYLYKAYRLAREQKQEIFCVLGHPKLATPYSIKQLGQFCAKVAGEVKFVTISSLL